MVKNSGFCKAKTCKRYIPNVQLPTIIIVFSKNLLYVLFSNKYLAVKKIEMQFTKTKDVICFCEFVSNLIIIKFNTAMITTDSKLVTHIVGKYRLIEVTSIR